MAWGRCDDNFWRHRKVRALRDDMRAGCVGLFWMACAYSNDILTDGRIDPGVVTVLSGTLEQAEELVRVGLWEPGYVIHDFLHFNRSKAQVLALRAKRAEAGAKGADTRWHREDYNALREAGMKLTDARKRVLDEILERHDVTGAAWAANIMRASPDDPFGAVMKADREWQAKRRSEADAEEASWEALKREERAELRAAA